MRLYDEALRLMCVYQEHKDSEDEMTRRRATVALDRFLMENREEVIQHVVDNLTKKQPWYKRKKKKGGVEYVRSHQVNR